MWMPIDWRNYFRLFSLAFRDDPTPSRVARWAFLAVLFPAMNLVTNVCMALDTVLFPAFTRAKVDSPVFVIGHARSGTTLLHNLLARDEERFTWFVLWELLAPSLLQKKLVRWVAELDRTYWDGGLEARIRAWEDRAFAKGRQMHPFGLTMPEEDAFQMVPTFMQCQLGFFFPYMKESARLYKMDEHTSPREVENRKRLMRFYRGVIQRQVYLNSQDGGQANPKILLSKNPTFTGMIETLRGEFPDARFVVLMRNPFQTIPSLLKMMVRNWKMMGYDRDEISESLDVLADQCLHYYRYPFEALGEAPPDRAAFVDYRELVDAPRKTIEALYAQLGFDVSEAYGETLHAEEQRSRKHRAEHVYSLDEFGLTRDEIRAALPEAFARYGWQAPDSTE